MSELNLADARTKQGTFIVPANRSANGTVSAVTATYGALSSVEWFEFLEISSLLKSPPGASWSDIKKKYGL